jgi:hypothetical protein
MLTDQALRGYEKYVMTERNLEETLNILPTNSEDYLFLKLIHTLHTKGAKVFNTEKEIKDQFEYLRNHYYSDRSQMIILREAILRYDTAETPKDKQEALNKIKDYCYWSHDYTKPTNLKKIKK